MNQRSDLPNSTRKGLKFALCYPYFSFLEARLGLWICLKHNKVIPIGTRGQQVGDISTVTQPVWSNSWAWASRKIEQVASCNLFLVISNVYLDHPFNGQCKHLWTARIFSSCETFIVHRMDRNSGNASVHFAVWVGLYVLYYPCAFQKKKKNTYFLERIASPGLEYILLYAVQLQIVHWKNFACLMKHGL